MSITQPRSNTGNNYVALIPAAGKGSRLPGRDGSKELLPIRTNDRGEALVVAEWLIGSFRAAGVLNVHIVLRQGKYDIIDHFRSGKDRGVQFSYHLTETEAGVPFTLNAAYPDYAEKNVLFGFPDILFDPQQAFGKLIAGLERDKGVDVLLGLFPVQDPEHWDTVVQDPGGRVTGIRIKETTSGTEGLAWILAAWRPSFSRFLHDWTGSAERMATMPGDEMHMGHCIRTAIEDGLEIRGLTFRKGRCLDVGTPGGYAASGAFLSQGD